MENLSNVEAFADNVDNLPLAVAAPRICPSDVRDAEVTSISVVTHICVDQMIAFVAFIHSPGKVTFVLG